MFLTLNNWILLTVANRFCEMRTRWESQECNDENLLRQEDAEYASTSKSRLPELVCGSMLYIMRGYGSFACYQVICCHDIWLDWI